MTNRYDSTPPGGGAPRPRRAAPGAWASRQGAARALAVVAFAALGALAVLALPAPAFAQEGPPIVVEGRYADFYPPNLIAVWELTEEGRVKRTYSLGDAAAADLREKLELEVLRREEYIELELRRAGAQVIVSRLRLLALDEVKRPFDIRAPRPSAEPPPGPTRGDAALADRRALFASLRRDDRVEVDGAVFAFERVLPGDLVELSRPGAGGGAVVRSLESMSQVRRIAREAPTAPVASAERDVRVADTVEVHSPDGRSVYGFVKSVDPSRIVIQTMDGKEVTIARDRETVILPIAADHPALRPVRVEPVLPPGPPLPRVAERKVKEIHGPFQLDTEANRYRFEGTVHHQEEGQLLLRARLAVTVKSQPLTYRDGRVHGRMVRPDKELALIERYQGRIPDEGAEDFGVPVFPIYLEQGLVVVTRESLHDRQIIPLVAVFPRHPKAYAVVTELLNPEVTVEVDYRDEDFVPFSDPRATAALMAAYSGAKGVFAAELERKEALSGMAASGDPRLISFLFYAHYLGDGSPKAIEETLRSFGRSAETWLIGVLDRRLWETGITVDGPEGAVRHTLQNPDQARASALSLLAVLQSEGAFPHALDALRESRSPELARAARAVFTERANPPLAWLVPRLTAESTEVRELLLDLDVRHKGTLARLYDSLDIVDPTFEGELAGLPEEEAAARYVRRIVRHFEEDPARRIEFSPVLAQAIAAKARVHDVLAAMPALLRDAAEGLVARATDRPPPQVDHRHWRTEEIRKAILLDPRNAEAKVWLGRIAREVAAELAQGNAVRNGPGDEWASLGAVRPGDIFQLASGAPSVPGWVAVSARSGVAYVSATTARAGPRRALALVPAPPIESQLELRRQAELLDEEERATHGREIVGLLTQLGREAADRGDWDAALKHFAEAASRDRSLYLVLSVVTAYFHARTWMPLAALAMVFLLLTSLLAGRSGSGPRLSGAPGGLSPLAPPPPPPADPSSAGSTRKRTPS